MTEPWKKVTVYETPDGKQHPNKAFARQHMATRDLLEFFKGDPMFADASDSYLQDLINLLVTRNGRAALLEQFEANDAMEHSVTGVPPRKDKK